MKTQFNSRALTHLQMEFKPRKRARIWSMTLQPEISTEPEVLSGTDTFMPLLLYNTLKSLIRYQCNDSQLYQIEVGEDGNLIEHFDLTCRPPGVWSQNETFNAKCTCKAKISNCNVICQYYLVYGCFPDPWKDLDDGSTVIVANVPMMFFEAVHYCKEAGGRLLEPDLSHTDEALSKLDPFLNDMEEYWTGITNADKTNGRNR